MREETASPDVPQRHRSGRLCSAATDAIGRRIVSGRIRPGEQLPTEAVLCDELGLSRTTVREAVKRLHGKGLVDGGPRTGMKVLPSAHWNQFDPDVLGWRVEGGIDSGLADQLYEVRGCIEPAACRMAAQRASPAERRRIRALFDRLAEEEDDVAAHVAADLAFHLAIFAATQNPFLISLGSAISTALELAFRQSQLRQRMSATELDLHRAIAQAIAAQQPDNAQHAMTRLLEVSRTTLPRPA